MALTRPRAAVMLLALAAALIAGCTVPRAPLGEPLERVDPAGGYRFANFADSRRQDDILFIVAFSGGGMRASAMAYGVLEQLAADHIGHDGARPRLLDEVDLISAVSGAAVTAAYYTVHGERLFTDFERRFLKRDVEGALRRRVLFDPGHWLRLMSSEYARGDLYARWFDRKLFGGARFADLEDGGSRPFLVLNATDLGVESRVEFTQDAFDPICVDLGSYPVARAVAASSAVPVFTTPITVLNRAGSCGYAPPGWVADALASEPRNSRRWARAFALRTYQDSATYRYLHLVDGALSDNLGVRTALDAIAAAGDPGALHQRLGVGRPRKIVLLTVNASGFQSEQLAARRQPPSLSDMIRMLGTVPVDRYSVESKALLREALARWSQVLVAEGRGGDLHHIEVELDAMRDQPRYARLLALPTTFNLPDADVDDLRCASRLLLAGNSEYRRLVLDLGGVEPRPGECR